MTRDDIIRITREAGLPIHWVTATGVIKWSELERFAALVKQHLIASGYRKCAEGQGVTQHCGMVEQAVKDEKEACARVCDLVAREIDDTNGIATYIAAAIRARGTT
jgi:hypothetical protein